MITHYPYDQLGGADHGWLKARHHFSFASYHDPARMSHGELIVINDDRIAPNTGFDTHPHRDMEIITYVRRGAITHKDSDGNQGRTTAGNVQVMSAGTGISHSEYNHEDEEAHIFQIWILPEAMGRQPKWDMAEFPKQAAVDTLPLLVSGDGQAPLQINQDARIYAGTLNAGAELDHRITGKAYLLISEGQASVEGIAGNKGDGFAVADLERIALRATTDAEILIIEVPGQRDGR